tara:strand:- start:55 stop:237 length:183 start_codon:yes stop_codon:yes gene_type:complete
LGPSIEDQIQSLITTLEGIVDDAAKTDKGQKAAGTRVRTALSEVAKSCKAIRVNVLAKRG